MFKKPFHVKTNAAMKSSDKRKLKSSVVQQFGEITSAQVDAIFPNKAPTTSMKITTHGGDYVTVYIVDGIPAFFENERLLYPTVYTLWKYPSLLPSVTTWPAVIDKLKGGADLMLPGLVVPTEGLPRLEKAQLCSVNAAGNLAPVAVGTAAISSADMFAAAMKGKGLITLHCLGDHLWEAGDKSLPPQISSLPNNGSASSENQTETTNCQNSSETNNSESDRTLPDGNGAETVGNAIGHSDDMRGESGLEEDVGAMAIGGGQEEEEDEEEDGISPTEAMDQLLYSCLLFSLKRKVKPSDLPLLTSTFYRNFIQPCCPKGRTLDMKKSSYKKLSKFLNAMQEKGLLEVKAISHGVDSVMSIRKDHTEIRSFVPPDDFQDTEDTQPQASQQTFASKAPEGPPEIRTYFAATPNQAPILQVSGFQRGAWLSKEDVREAVTAYIKKENLVDRGDFGRVMLDPYLCDAVTSKTENITHLKWDQLFTRFLHKMTSGYQIIFPGDLGSSNPRIHKGQVQPIKLKVERKAGNKWITVIQSLEQFSIDPRDFAHRLQIAVAASTTVGEGANAKAGTQVTVQGNQLKFLDKFLTGHYQIPRRYIEGLQQAPKPKGKGKR